MYFMQLCYSSSSFENCLILLYPPHLSNPASAPIHLLQAKGCSNAKANLPLQWVWYADSIFITILSKSPLGKEFKLGFDNPLVLYYPNNCQNLYFY